MARDPSNRPRRRILLLIQAAGRIALSRDVYDAARPNGHETSLRRRSGAGMPMPSQPPGILIGRIGNGAPFVIGSGGHIRMPASGQLSLGVNDDDGADNAGEFSVSIDGPLTH